jgi:2-polyprenyl-6-methoxyphenol hydroxylase-like FAD-dependent oxidoreductase
MSADIHTVHGLKGLLSSVLLAVLLAHGNAFNVASTGHMGLLRNAGSRTTVARHRGQARPLSLLLSTAPSEGGRDGILIVGGGPSGLGAALELDTIMNSELRGMWGGMGSTITVVEKMKPMSSYDPTKGFMYLVSEPGLKFCDRHGLSQTVAQEGVDGSTLNGNRIAIDGTRSKFTFSFGDIRAPYWLPRHGFVSILENAVRARPSVDLKDGWEVKELRRVQDGGDTVVEALLQGPGGEQNTMRPFLIVGADGLSSVVRTSLSRWAAEDGDNSGKFEMYEAPSASGGLRYKVLKLKGSFPLPPAPAAKGAEASSSSSTRDMIEADKSYSFLSRYQGSLKDKKRETRLGLLPLKERYGYRTANIITLPDHSIWTNATLSTQAGMKAFLSESYPQMDWASAVTEEELERFAKSPGWLVQQYKY